MSDSKLKIWSCKIGEAPNYAVPSGADMPMRQAVERAYREITRQSPAFIFSGWGAELSEFERAVVENREPNATAESADVSALRARLEDQRLEIAQLQEGLRHEQQCTLCMRSHDDCERCSLKAALVGDPSDWLAKHDAEVRAKAIEEAAKVAEAVSPNRLLGHMDIHGARAIIRTFVAAVRSLSAKEGQ